MEYFLGSLTTLIIMAYFGTKSAKVLGKPQKKVRVSQSYVDRLVFNELFKVASPKPKKKRQTTNHSGEEVRVIVIDGHAYWIHQQTLFTADMVHGFVDKNTTRKVDTMTMDGVELEKTQFIVQKLTEGKKDDSGDKWKP